MNQKCIGKITQVKDTLSEIVDGLGQLENGIEQDYEDAVADALESLPSDRAMRKCFENLGLLLQGAPWEGRRKGKKND